LLCKEIQVIPMKMKSTIFGIALLIAQSTLYADRIVLKSGLFYDGSVIEETQDTILFRRTVPSYKILRIPRAEVFSVAKDTQTAHSESLTTVYVSAETLMLGNVTTSSDFSTDPAATLKFNVGFRFHPMIQIDGGLLYTPSQSGNLHVFNATTGDIRGYEHFDTLGGGFGGRFFPFALSTGKIEPYLLGGYQWTRMTPKGTEDRIKGHSIYIGTGASYPIYQHFFLEGQVLWQKSSFHHMNIQGQETDFRSTPTIESVLFGLGISYRY